MKIGTNKINSGLELMDKAVSSLADIPVEKAKAMNLGDAADAIVKNGLNDHRLKPVG